MATRISVLIPVYNDVCTRLVARVSEIAEATPELVLEIIVADDGSDNAETIAENSHISAMPRCQYIKRTSNVGRAAIRNFLARQAKYEWLLYLDCDVEIPDNNFLSNYVKATVSCEVAYGGLSISGDSEMCHGNLRYIYEKHCEPRQSASMRAKHPYQSFRTTNFFIKKEVMLSHPFNEQIRTYGYEDVMLGKTLHDSSVNISHIDNQVHYTRYESNAAYLAKTAEAMHTLFDLRKDLASYSSLIKMQRRLHLWRLDTIIDRVFLLMRRSWRRKLESPHPTLNVFNAYRLCIFNHICLQHHNH